MKYIPWVLTILFLFSCTEEETGFRGSFFFSDGTVKTLQAALYDAPELPAGLDSLVATGNTAFLARGLWAANLARSGPAPLEQQTSTGELTFSREAEPGELLLLYDSLFVYALLAVEDFTEPLALNTGVLFSGEIDSVVHLPARTPAALEGDVIFTNTASLTVEENCFLTSRSGFLATIQCPVTLEGTAEAPIFMCPHPAAADFSGHWDMVLNDELRLDYMVFGGWEHGMTALYSSPQIENSLFAFLDNTALRISQTSREGLLDNCFFWENDLGLSLESALLKLRNSLWSRCRVGLEAVDFADSLTGSVFAEDSVAVLLNEDSPLEVSGNRFYHNHNDFTFRRYCQARITENRCAFSRDYFIFSRVNSEPTVHHNNILSPGGYLVWINGSTPYSGGFDARENFWGYVDSLEIEEHIRDSLDRADLIRVDFSNYFPEPLPLVFP